MRWHQIYCLIHEIKLLYQNEKEKEKQEIKLKCKMDSSTQKRKKKLIPNTDGLTIPNTLQYTNFFFFWWDSGS